MIWYDIYIIMRINNKLVKINFWDVAGDPVYFEVRNEFYRETHGVNAFYKFLNLNINIYT